jgi:hypothetical protein
MHRWKARMRLTVLAAVCIAAGIAAPFLPVNARTDVLAVGVIAAGLAVLVAALTNHDEDDHGGP